MRKILGPLLLGLGGFLLTTALLALVWVPGQVKKTPVNVNSVTTAEGEASYLGSDRGTVKGTSHTATDGKASTGDVAVFTTFSCLLWNPDGNAPDCVSGEGEDSDLINAGTDAFATDRTTALSLEDQERYVGANASPHQGLVNKFPFDVEKRTYPFWDGILDRAVDATFVGEEAVLGLQTYQFNIDVQDEPAEISSGVQGQYSLNKTMWIDPVTGSIIKQSETQLRTLPDGSAALDMDLAFTADQVQSNVDAAKDNGSRLSLISGLPWIAGLLGLLSLLAGLFLLRREEEPEGDLEVEARRPRVSADPPVAVGATPAPTRPGSAPTPLTTPDRAMMTPDRSGATPPRPVPGRPDEPTRPLFGPGQGESTTGRRPGEHPE